MRYDVATAAGLKRSRSIPVRATESGGEDVSITGLVVFLAIGAVAGWLAGTLMKGGGFGLLGNIVVGIIGAVVGGFVFGLLGITAGGLIGSIVTATAGAILLLFIVGLVRKS
jgi:uncharacterized membrane protein YeaQ/YmgE (transglycosylase-associated protein family)